MQVSEAPKAFAVIASTLLLCLLYMLVRPVESVKHRSERFGVPICQSPCFTVKVSPQQTRDGLAI